mgnify:CR=1 FL=1
MSSAGLKLKIIFYLSLLLVLGLIGYKIYLNFFEQDYEAVHTFKVENIEKRLAGRNSYRFAVVGNINNSIGIFERKIIPLLNRSGVDFVVSAGNAVSSGGEDKYRAIYRTLERLKMPYLLTFGENEHSRLGSFRFYDHYGPYYYSFDAGNSRFIFFDSTGKTDYRWQMQWLEESLSADTPAQIFFFSSQSLQPPAKEKGDLFAPEDPFPAGVRRQLEMIIQQAGAAAVFSTSEAAFSDRIDNQTHHVLTGGAGGLVPSTTENYYHYVEVTVDGNRVVITPKPLDVGQHPFWRTLEGLWFWVHGLFYVGYLNFVLLLSALMALSLWLYLKIFTDHDYYPNFDLDPSPYLSRALKVMMFTNNYLPFIGGVPISIERLRRGLITLGHKILIVAPKYSDTQDQEDVVRLAPLLPLGRHKEFLLANIFSWKLYRRTFQFRPDLIHVHHPFWLGSVGLFLARRLKIPVVYTYHTRLEQYAHYVPLPGPLFRNLVSHQLLRHFANRCDSVVVPTESVEDYLRLIGIKKPIYVQPTGINFDSFQSVPEQAIQELRTQLGLTEEKIFISISRLSKEKNIDFIIDAMEALLKNQLQPFRLLILGDGPERPRLEARLAQAGLAEKVILLGQVPPEEIATYCQLGDLFLFASRSETQGMVILEAMAAGMPVVAVRSSGIDDLVHNGMNGFKTPLDTKQWTDRISQLLTDEKFRQTLSQNARRFAQEYDIEPFCRSIQKIYALTLAEYQEKHALDDGLQQKSS